MMRREQQSCCDGGRGRGGWGVGVGWGLDDVKLLTVPSPEVSAVTAAAQLS